MPNVQCPRWGVAVGSADSRNRWHPRLTRMRTPTNNLDSVGIVISRSHSAAVDGSLVTGVTWSGAVTGSVGATYDNNFRVTSLSVNGSNPTTLSYDSDGLLTGAGDLITSRSALNGRVDSTRLGSVTTADQFDNFGQWIHRTAQSNGSQLLRCELHPRYFWASQRVN
jgi:YD repeat-containing protein